MNSAIIQYEDLKEVVGGRSPANVVVRLKKSNIQYKLGYHGRPFTTVDALNQSLGIISHGQHTLELEPSKPVAEIL